MAAVTGAASGIGQALAKALAKEGCHLALSDVDSVGLKKTVSELKQFDVKVCHDVLDVSDHAAMNKWADNVVDYHGKVNLIFNNAGVAMGGTTTGSTKQIAKAHNTTQTRAQRPTTS